MGLITIVLFVLFIAVLGYTAAIRVGANRRLNVAKGNIEEIRHLEYLARLRHRDLDAFAKAAKQPDAIFVKDLQGRYLLGNPANAKIVGRPAADILGHDDATLFSADSASAALMTRADSVGNMSTILLSRKAPGWAYSNSGRGAWKFKMRPSRSNSNKRSGKAFNVAVSCL